MFARGSFSIIDNTSGATAQAAKGVFGVIGEAAQGRIGESVSCQSVTDFEREFGDVSFSVFSEQCALALREGASLRVSRVVHYADITDISTISGAKATCGSLARAKNVGTWGNSIKIKIETAYNQTKKVVTITPKDKRFVEKFEVNALLTSDDLALLNSSRYVEFLSEVGDELQNASNLAFANGTETGATNSDDYLLALNAFNSNKDIWYISALGKAQNDIDNQLVSYATQRGDVIALLRTPLGLTASGILAYINATAPYTGTPIDSPFAFMFSGGVLVTKVGKKTATLEPELGLVAAAIARKNRDGEPYDAFGGVRFGVLNSARGVAYNLALPQLLTDADAVTDAGVNPIIQDDNKQVVIWGNYTMLRDRDKLLSRAHVAELVMHVKRLVKPIRDKYLIGYDNIPKTWKALFLEVRPILENLKSGAIWDYQYFGDQNADKITDVTFNSIDYIQSGRYKAKIVLYPTAKMEAIEIELQLDNPQISVSENG